MATRLATLADVFGNRLRAWYDAQDAATLTVSGGVVSQWADKSVSSGARTGTAYPLANSTASAQPALVASGINGYPALRFSSKKLRGALSLNGKTVSVFGVTQVSTGFGNNGRIFSAAAPNLNDYNSDSYFNISTNAGQIALWFYRNGTTQGNVNFSPDAPLVFSGVYSGTAGTLFKDGSPGNENKSYTAAAAVTQLTLGDNNNASIGGTSEPFSGLTGELGFVEGGHTVAERQMAEGVLAWKWGTQANLPANHPCKAAAPTVDDGTTAAPSKSGQAVIASTSSVMAAGAKSGRGAAAASTTSARAVAGRRAAQGVASAASASSLAAGGRRASAGIAAASTATATTAAGAKAAAGAASVGSATSGTPAGLKRSSGEAATASASMASGAGRKLAAGAGSSASASTGAATGSASLALQERQGAASATSSSTVAGAGRKRAVGSASAASTASATASGRASQAGAGAAASVSASSAAVRGLKGSRGAARLASASAATAAGGKAAGGAARLASASAATAAGSKAAGGVAVGASATRATTSGASARFGAGAATSRSDARAAGAANAARFKSPRVLRGEISALRKLRGELNSPTILVGRVA